MSQRITRNEASRRDAKREATSVERELQRAFTPAVIDKLRAKTGYNPRQRVGTALRLMLTVVEAFLVGQTRSLGGDQHSDDRHERSAAVDGWWDVRGSPSVASADEHYPVASAPECSYGDPKWGGAGERQVPPSAIKWRSV